MIGYLFISGLIFGLVGMYSLIDPNAALGPTVGLHIETVNSFSQERGTAGGVTAAIGIFLIASAHYRQLVLSALWMVVVVLGGLEAGRLTSLILDGRPGGIIWFYMAVEVLGLLQGLYWLRQELSIRREIATAAT
jgi:hypothetical protein